MRIAVLGVGTIARSVHLPLIARHPGLELVAVGDLDEARAAGVARAYGARAQSPAALIAAADVEAVLIATPGNHAAIAADALRAGKHVLAEKPLALTVADALAVADLAAERGLVAQVGSMKAHDAAVGVVRAALAEIGELRLVEVSVRHPVDAPQLQHLRLDPPAPPPPVVAEAARAGDWADAERVRAAVGDLPPAWHGLYRSVLCGSVLHEVSLLRALGTGLPAVFDHAALVPGEPGPPVLTATGPLPSGARLQLSWAWLPDYPEYEETVRLVGTAGAVVLDLAPPYVLDARSSVEVLTRGDGPAGVRRRAVLGHDGAFQRQLEAFAAAVRTGAPVLVDAAGAAADVACLQRLLAALAAGHGLVPGGEAAAAAAVPA
nr:Gfo/Idh/MocA family oxidoreductase [Kineococcus siccus]